VYQAALRGHHGAGGRLDAFHFAYLVGGAIALLGVVGAALSRSTERHAVASVEALEALDVTERQPVVLSTKDGAHSDLPIEVV